MTKEERKVYMRRYYAEHSEYRERLKRAATEWRKKHPDKVAANKKKYRQMHAEDINAKRRKHYAEDPVYRAKVADWAKRYNANKKQLEAHRLLPEIHKESEEPYGKSAE